VAMESPVKVNLGLTGFYLGFLVWGEAKHTNYTQA
jgi:hypothetical protein